MRVSKKHQKTAKSEQFHPHSFKKRRKIAKKSKKHTFPNLGKFHPNSLRLMDLRHFPISVPQNRVSNRSVTTPIISPKTSISPKNVTSSPRF
jgi:hypothetical protein